MGIRVTESDNSTLTEVATKMYTKALPSVIDSFQNNPNREKFTTVLGMYGEIVASEICNAEISNNHGYDMIVRKTTFVPIAGIDDGGHYQITLNAGARIEVKTQFASQEDTVRMQGVEGKQGQCDYFFFNDYSNIDSPRHYLIPHDQFFKSAYINDSTIKWYKPHVNTFYKSGKQKPYHENTLLVNYFEVISGHVEIINETFNDDKEINSMANRRVMELTEINSAYKHEPNKLGLVPFSVLDSGQLQMAARNIVLRSRNTNETIKLGDATPISTKRVFENNRKLAKVELDKTFPAMVKGYFFNKFKKLPVDQNAWVVEYTV